MANDEQDWTEDPEPGEHAAAPPDADPSAGSGGPEPARPRSVWADMLISGPGDSGWPPSGLPPSFGQRPAAGERPSFEDAGLAGSPYGGSPLEAQPGPAGTGMPEPGPGGYGFVASPAPDVAQARGWTAPAAPYRPWETYEAETGYEPAVGYGAAGQPTAPAPETEDGWNGSYAPDDAAAEREPEPYGLVPEGEPAAPYGEQPGWHAAPPSGWRRAVYRVTAGRVRGPQSTADRRRTDLVLRARTPVAGGHHRVAVLSLKGGVGKTTTTVGLGSTLASLRGDRVIAIDANPDRGTLCDKLRLETAATVRDLLNEENQIRRYADVRAYTTQAPSGLEVLASDRDPTVSVAFGDEDYEDVAQVLEHYYSVSITDCGTGLLHSAMAGVLRLADQIVLVSSPSVDGARSASATLDWLAAHQYGDLVRGAVVVLSAIRPRSKSTVDAGQLEQHFAARCRSVVRVPYDAHLEEGAEIDLGQLGRATADAYLVLAAEVGDGFAYPRR